MIATFNPVIGVRKNPVNPVNDEKMQNYVMQ